MELNIEPRRVLGVLIRIAVGFYVLGFALEVTGNLTGRHRLLGFGEMFSLAGEANIPAWFSSALLLVAAGLLALVARSAKGDRYSSRWRALSGVFLYLSVDEAASIHETFATAVRNLTGSEAMARYGFVIPGVFVVAGTVLFFARFALGLPARTRRLFAASAALYVGGALVMEGVGRGWEVLRGVHNLPYAAIMTTEEFAEMAGVVLFIYALLVHLAAHAPAVHLRIGRP
ncbi:MAG: hypothetical protein ACYC2Y_10595 [Armatimonadota bacterium]